MRILFVLDRVENAASANALMGFRLAEQLVARDHSVHILTLWDGLHTPPAPPEGVVQHLLAFADERLMNEALENGRRGGTPVPLRLARLAAHPTAVAAAFRQLVLKRPRRTVDTQREIERLDAEFHYDAVCAVCAPYRAAFALEDASIGGKKYLWQLGRAGCWTRWMGPSSRRRPCPTMPTMPRWRTGAKRPMCWASRRCCRGSAARKNTTICGAFSAAACTRNCGSRTLRRHCSAPCPAQT